MYALLFGVQKIKVLIMHRFFPFFQLLTFHLHKAKNTIMVFINRVFYYSGLKFIYRQFVPVDYKTLLKGVIWLSGLYFAAYTFTAQRYEFQLDRIEYKYNLFITQIGSGGIFSNTKLMGILNETTPVKPSISKPITIYKSFRDGLYVEYFYQTNTDRDRTPFKSSSAFREEIIRDWKQNLNGANFELVQLKGADFNSAQLKGAKFVKAQLDGAYFMDANLEGANFYSAQLKGAKFSKARLDGAYFTDANLEGADFMDANLEGANFYSAQLKESKFYFAQLKGAKFYKTTLEGADFSSGQLEGADFSSGQLKGTVFSNAKLKKAKFDEAKFEEVYFNRAQLDGAYFTDANLAGADFDAARLEGAYFSNAELKGVTFYMANLKGAYFKYAQLKGAYFLDANLEGAHFDEVLSLKAEQLILAKNIYGIKNCPEAIIEKIKGYGCFEMLTKRPEQWPKQFEQYRQELISKSKQFEQYRQELISIWEKRNHS